MQRRLRRGARHGNGDELNGGREVAGLHRGDRQQRIRGRGEVRAAGPGDDQDEGTTSAQSRVEDTLFGPVVVVKVKIAKIVVQAFPADELK